MQNLTAVINICGINVKVTHISVTTGVDFKGLDWASFCTVLYCGGARVK